MTESPQFKDNSPITVVDSTRQSIEQLCAIMPESRLSDLVAWFPTADEQLEIEQADSETKATFIAEALGHYTAWLDATEYLHIYRPQDGGTAAGDLGLTRDQAFEIYPLAQKTTSEIGDYIGFLVDDMFDGNFELIAVKLKTAGQALGFNIVALRTLRRENYTQDPDINVKISFEDESASLETPYSQFFMDEAQRDLPVGSASYDQQSRNLKLHLSARI